MATNAPARRIIPRAWFSASIDHFRAADRLAILGELQANSAAAGFDVAEKQSQSRLDEIDTLQLALHEQPGAIHLEFGIPRMGDRVDAIVLIGPAVFVLEFKRSDQQTTEGLRQVWRYALETKHFHEASHSAYVIPTLIAPGAPAVQKGPEFAQDDVAMPVWVEPAALGSWLTACTASLVAPAIEPATWIASPYHPTPTIVEAAQALYAGNTVAEIAHSEASSEELERTSSRLIEIAQRSRAQQRKSICFVTGVPGAGKTLVGLNLATHDWQDGQTHALYLSGNGPLVAVLRAALTRDAQRRKRADRGCRRGMPEGIPVKKFIQNVHELRKDQLSDNPKPPAEHVLVFDEAQRAWNRSKLANFLKDAHFPSSEPELLLQHVDRLQGWATSVCLVGGGQEINTGEADIATWLDAIADRFPSWDVYLPAHMNDREYAAGPALETLVARGQVQTDDALHLSVAVRHFRAEQVSTFITALLNCDSAGARQSFTEFSARYPIALTRNLPAAKRWLRNRARGADRYGLLASSNGMRLKPDAVDVRVKVDPVHWFLNGPDDTRSSFYLEDAATEFDVQGLELDWTCVAWDGDLRFNGAGWAPWEIRHHAARGTRWQHVHNSWRQMYALNAYRVLLTRARKGMAIYVPGGDASGHDETRNPAFYDATFNFLASLGLPVLA